MNQKKLIIRDTYYYVLSKLFPGILGLIYVLVFTRLVGIEEYGKYSLNLYQINLIVSFCFGWLNQSELRFGNQKQHLNPQE